MSSVRTRSTHYVKTPGPLKATHTGSRAKSRDWLAALSKTRKTRVFVTGKTYVSPACILASSLKRQVCSWKWQKHPCPITSDLIWIGTRYDSDPLSNLS